MAVTATAARRLIQRAAVHRPHLPVSALNAVTRRGTSEFRRRPRPFVAILRVTADPARNIRNRRAHRVSTTTVPVPAITSIVPYMMPQRALVRCQPPSYLSDVTDAGRNGSRRQRKFDWQGLLGISIFIGGFAGVLWACNELGKRERVICADRVDTSDPQNHEYRDIQDFEIVSEKPKGNLSGAILRDKKTGVLYMKKGAATRSKLLIEYAVANYLHAAQPWIQPESLILQEPHPDGTARFYSLIKLVPKSCDLEDFLLQPDWKNKLQKKPLKNLAGVLATDCVLGKQGDIKAANILIVEFKQCYYAVSIDHEYFGGNGVFGELGEVLESLDQEAVNRLFFKIHDAHPRSDMNQSGLAGHPVMREFRDFVMDNDLLRPCDVRAAYDRLARLPAAQINKLIRETAVAGRYSIFSEADAERICAEIHEVQTAISDVYPHYTAATLEGLLPYSLSMTKLLRPSRVETTASETFEAVATGLHEPEAADAAVKRPCGPW